MATSSTDMSPVTLQKHYDILKAYLDNDQNKEKIKKGSESLFLEIEELLSNARRQKNDSFSFKFGELLKELNIKVTTFRDYFPKKEEEKAETRPINVLSTKKQENQFLSEFIPASSKTDNNVENTKYSNTAEIKSSEFFDLIFNNILLEINRIENILKQYPEDRQEQLRGEHIKEALLVISWRTSEIDKKYKYNAQSGKIKIGEIFHERNWLLLDYLAEAINISSNQADSSKILTFINKFCFLDEKGNLSEKSELGKLKNILPTIKNIFLALPIPESKLSFYMEELEDFVSIYLDEYLLEKMENAISYISSKNLPILQKDIISILRCFEVLGECSQNLSFILRCSFPNSGWLSDKSHKLNKKSKLHDFRTIIHHDRDKVELILTYETDLIHLLLSNLIPAIYKKIQFLRKIRSNILLSEKEIITTNTILVENCKKFSQSEKESTLLDDTIFSPLQKIVDIVNNPTKLPSYSIKRLLGDIVKNTDTFYFYKILFEKIPYPKEKEFMELVEKNIEQPQKIKDKIIKKFQAAYRILQGYQLTIFEIESALRSQKISKLDDLEKIKEGIRQAIEGSETLSREEFQKKYLDPLIFGKDEEDLTSAKKSTKKKSNTLAEKIKYQIDLEEKLYKLKTYCTKNLDEKSIRELFVLNEQEEKIVRESASKQLKESNEALGKVLSFREKISKEFNKGYFKKILGVHEEELQELHEFFSKVTFEEKLRERLSKSNRIRKLILDEIAIRAKIKNKEQLKSMLKDVLELTSDAANKIVLNFKFPAEKISEDNIKIITETLDTVIQNEKQYAEYLEKPENIKEKEKIIKESRSIETQNEIRDFLTKVPHNEESYFKWQEEIKRELINVVLGQQDMEEKEFEHKLKLLNYSDSYEGNIRNEYYKRQHVKNPKKNMEDVEKILALVDMSQTSQQFLETILYTEKFIDCEEENFKKIAEKTGYNYSPHFDKLYTKIKKRILTYQEIESIVQAITVEDKLTEHKLHLRIKHILSSNLSSSDEENKKLIEEYRTIIKEQVDRKKTPAEPQEFLSHALKILDKLIKKESNSFPLTKSSVELMNAIQKISEIFIKIANEYTASDPALTPLIPLLEYYIEEAGQASEELIHHPHFLDSDDIAFSFQYLHLVAICRKSMAHYPLTINRELLQYVAQSLTVDTQLRIEEIHKISFTTFVKTVMSESHRLLTLEMLNSYKDQIFLTIIGLGFKSNIKIFHQTLGCSISVQADMCFLVEPEEQVRLGQLIELELRLCKLLKSSVRIYTKASLSEQIGTKLQEKHVRKILEKAKDLNAAILESKFKKLFKEKKWSTAHLPGVGKVDQTDYLERQDFEKIFQFLLGKSIDSSDVQEILDNPSSLSDNFQRIFSTYNLNKESFSKQLLEFMDLLNQRIILPLVIKYRSLRIPIRSTEDYNKYFSTMPIIKEKLDINEVLPKEYPARIIVLDKTRTFIQGASDSDFHTMLTKFGFKPPQKLSAGAIKTLEKAAPYHLIGQGSFPIVRSISPLERKEEIEKVEIETITIKELWNYNNFMLGQVAAKFREKAQRLYELFINHSMSQGVAILTHRKPDDTVIINWQGHLVKLSKHEIDLFYVKNVGPYIYQKFDIVYSHLIFRIKGYSDVENISSVCDFLTKTILYGKSYLMRVMDNNRKLDESIFSKLSMVEYAFEEQELKNEREKTKNFRKKRLQTTKAIDRIVKEKSYAFINSLFNIIKEEKKKYRNRMQCIRGLLSLDALINEQLDHYYFEHEYDLTFLSHTMDVQQRVGNMAMSKVSRVLPVISTKYDFRKVVKDKISIIKDKKIREKVQLLLNDRAKALAELKEIMCREVYINPYPLLFEGIKVDERGKVLNVTEVVLTQANKYYNKFVCLFEDINSKLLIEKLFAASATELTDLYTITYQLFADKYSEKEQYQGVVVFDETTQLQRVDFSSEVEFQLVKEKEEKMIKIKEFPIIKDIQLILKRYSNGYIKTGASSATSSYTYKVPNIVNGILGYSSGLDRELPSIHAQIASHLHKRMPLCPTVLIEDLPHKLWNARTIQIGWGSEVRATSIFKPDISCLEDLLNLHGWTDEERKRYKEKKSYRADEILITEYYQFRQNFDRLMDIALRMKEAQILIRKNFEDMQTHHTMARYEESYYLEQQLRYYVVAYKKLIREQETLIDTIMNLPYVKKRITSVLNDADELATVSNFIKSRYYQSPPPLQEITRYILWALGEIEQKTRKELLAKTKVTLPDMYISKIINSIDCIDLVSINIIPKSNGEVMFNISPVLTYVFAKKRETEKEKRVVSKPENSSHLLTQKIDGKVVKEKSTLKSMTFDNFLDPENNQNNKKLIDKDKIDNLASFSKEKEKSASVSKSFRSEDFSIDFKKLQLEMRLTDVNSKIVKGTKKLEDRRHTLLNVLNPQLKQLEEQCKEQQNIITEFSPSSLFKPLSGPSGRFAAVTDEQKRRKAIVANAKMKLEVLENRHKTCQNQTAIKTEEVNTAERELKEMQEQKAKLLAEINSISSSFSSESELLKTKSSYEYAKR